jgi:hypothetical protein
MSYVKISTLCQKELFNQKNKKDKSLEKETLQKAVREF